MELKWAGKQKRKFDVELTTDLFPPIKHYYGPIKYQKEKIYILFELEKLWSQKKNT